MLRYALALLPLLSLLGAALSAQAPFAELRPSGALQPASLLQRGKMLVYPEPGRVSIYSAFRQRWLSIPVQGVPTIRHANDWVLVRDGARWTAVGSYRFVPESLVLSGAAAELNPASQRNDSLLLVQDGADVHAFSGFTGKWHSRRPGSNFAFAVQRHCAVIARQDELLGISAFDGQWRSQAVRGQAHSLAADGTLGLAELGGELWGFSAETRSWAKHAALPGAALRIVGADVAVWHDATRCVAFSGLRGRFVQQAIPAISSVLVQRKFALVQTRGAVQAFSGPLASWSQLVPAAPLRMRDSSGLALLIEAGRVLAYSALRGDFAALTHGAAREELGAAVAIVQDAGTGQWFYSGFDGLWRAQPANALGVAAQGGYATALLRIAGGVVAFSAKSGAFVPLSCSANAMLHADTGSSVIAVAEAGSLHVFDPRRERWLSASVAASVTPNVQIWRTTLLAEAGGEWLGFGSQHGRLDRFRPMGLGQALSSGVSSESARVEFGAALFGYSALGRLLPVAQFPEFRRVHPAGELLRLEERAAPGDVSLLLLGLPAPAPLLTPFGELELDANLLFFGPAQVVGSAGHRRHELLLPRSVTLGRELCFQSLQLGPSTQAVLTRPVRVCAQ
jgi:hypothetical protein